MRPGLPASRTSLSATLVLALFAITGCGRSQPASDQDQIAAVVKRVFVAELEGDSQTYCSLLTGKAYTQSGAGGRARCKRQKADPGAVSEEERQEVRSAKVKEIRVEGARASVSLRLASPEAGVPGQDIPVRVEKVDGRWLVSDLDPRGYQAEVEEGFKQAEQGQHTADKLNCSSFRFDEAQWRRLARDEATTTPTRRQRLADALIKCRTLLGLSSDEAAHLLGRPDNAIAEAGELSWQTGPERNYIAIDNEHLVLRLDRRRRIGSAKLNTD